MREVVLHRPPRAACDVSEIATWLSDRVDAAVETAEPFLERRGDAEIAEAFAHARVLSPHERETGSDMYGVKQYEERLLAEPERTGGVLYDGLAMQRAFQRHVAGDPDRLDVLILDRHLGTWGEHDGRWHKRIAVLGRPALLSVPGVAEAPAKPEAYYQLKQRHALVHGDAPPREVLEAAIDEDVLVPGDPRTTDVLKGYVLAAVHLIATGEAFCSDPQCRLFDGHRHEAVIRAQLESPTFCPRHRERYAGG